MFSLHRKSEKLLCIFRIGMWSSSRQLLLFPKYAHASRNGWKLKIVFDICLGKADANKSVASETSLA